MIDSAKNPSNGHAADRAETNRANAAHSTGPRTEPGKKRVSLNALRHGLTAQTIVMPEEDLAAYQRHAEQFFDQFQPKTPIETQLVQTIVESTWRLNRVAALETNILALGATRQAESIRTEHPEAHAALATAAAFCEHSRALANLSIQEHRISRRFDKALQQLREIQAERLAHEQQQLCNAARLLKMHKEEGLPYNPAEDGFVFSNTEIETYVHRHDRSAQADRANVIRATA
ncbi:MAG TPA: hypothetical protein VEU96_03975 [Bryobacteraceae bacterium]|nr:hypothetical protein [Bryobacteraceae bacterium]